MPFKKITRLEFGLFSTMCFHYVTLKLLIMTCWDTSRKLSKRDRQTPMTLYDNIDRLRPVWFRWRYYGHMAPQGQTRITIMSSTMEIARNQNGPNTTPDKDY